MRELWEQWAGWVLGNLALLAALEVVGIGVLLALDKQSRDAPLPLFPAAAVVYALLLFPAFLAPTGVAYLALLVAVRRRFVGSARAVAVALSPVATLLLLLWALAARAPASLAIVVAGSAAYGLLVRLPPRVA